MSGNEIETLSSRMVYENRWMTVREDSIRRSNGKLGIYGVVEKRDFVVIVPLDGTRTTLVQQYRYPVGQRFWEFPQGSWEDSDVPPEELARAELKEETGLVAEVLSEVGHLYVAYGYSNQAYRVFVARGLKKDATDLDDEELGLVARDHDLKEVEEMILSGAIKDATTIAALGLLKMKGIL